MTGSSMLTGAPSAKNEINAPAENTPSAQRFGWCGWPVSRSSACRIARSRAATTPIAISAATHTPTNQSGVPQKPESGTGQGIAIPRFDMKKKSPTLTTFSMSGAPMSRIV